MNSKLLSLLSVVGALLMTLLPAHAAADQAAYAVCAACHGQNGEGNVAMNAPKLAGMEPWYLKRQLQAYKDGIRGTAPGDTFGMQMQPMAMAVGDMDSLAAYIASLPDVDVPATVEGDAGAGQSAYAVCGSCHGQKGEGNEQLGGPRLAGLDDWYLVRQINNYRKNLRGYDSKDIYGNQMKPMVATLTTDQAVNDLVAYINTLK